jgi:hypothetical protein
VSSSHTHWLCQILQQTNPTTPVSVDGRDGVFVMLVVSANAFQPHLRVTPFARGLPREAVSVLTTLGARPA